MRNYFDFYRDRNSLNTSFFVKEPRFGSDFFWDHNYPWKFLGAFPDRATPEQPSYPWHNPDQEFSDHKGKGPKANLDEPHFRDSSILL